MSKLDMESELNEITGLGFKWSKLNKKDLEELYDIMTTREKLVQLALTVTKNKGKIRRKKRKGEIKETVAQARGEIKQGLLELGLELFGGD